jgi:hypothetical protein
MYISAIMALSFCISATFQALIQLQNRFSCSNRGGCFPKAMIVAQNFTEFE